ncbi:MAG: DNA cytosine methyltransferase [Colwellia sp.]|nr:DNA cytosine methyltransferase [Colwellia sp.]
MRYASVCSGVEAASLAWEPLGWEPVWFSQFDPEHNYKLGPDFPSAVLKQRWPHVPNLGDMTKLCKQEIYKREIFDLLVGGTPCQDYSIAGLRAGLDGERGQLTLEYVRILERKQPRWFVWENVPGVLSSNSGRDFNTFIHDLKEIGYSIAWRVLDAQYCGVPQRRRRVFVVGYLGDDWRPPAAVLFERQSMPGYFKPSKETEQEVAKCLRARAGSSNREDSDNFVVQNGSHWDNENNPHPTLNQSHNTGGIAMSNQELFSQRGGGLVKTFDMEAFGQYGDGSKASTVKARDYKDATDLVVEAACFKRGQGATARSIAYGPKAPTLTASASGTQQSPGLHMGNVVRRLTEVEGERLQGMPDHHTNIIWKGKPAPSGQRYKAIGNSMAVPAMAWIGKRIDFVDGLLNG